MSDHCMAYHHGDRVVCGYCDESWPVEHDLTHRPADCRATRKPATIRGPVEDHPPMMAFVRLPGREPEPMWTDESLCPFRGGILS